MHFSHVVIDAVVTSAADNCGMAKTSAAARSVGQSPQRLHAECTTSESIDSVQKNNSKKIDGRLIIHLSL